MRRSYWLGAVLTVALACWALPVQAVEKEAVDTAVARGVDFLLSLQQSNGHWQFYGDGGRGAGFDATPLIGLALLECGRGPDDPAIKKAAEVVRADSVHLERTYLISLTILFLDRLGDPLDVPLIESLTVRLLGGMSSTGGWGYICPEIPESEQRRLNEVLKKRAELKGSTTLPRNTPGKRTVQDLPKEIQQALEQVRFGQGDPRLSFGDNSNTQFALLALWVARKHGLPVDKALTVVERRFRTSVNRDGGWGYEQGHDSTPAMTSAGLLGLAVSHGVAKDNVKGAVPPEKDPQIKTALIVLSTSIDNPAMGSRPILKLGKEGGRSFYFLWTLERMAVALGLETIGGKDWYNWGAEILLENQQNDGGWYGEYWMGGVDTAFALLFLKRANLARDLTATLKGKVQDPGEAALKGVRLEDLPSGGKLKSGVGTDDKPSDPPAKPPETVDEPAQLGAQLVKAPANQQAAILEKLHNGKGSAYTQALAAAIPRLEGDTRKKAREALADRMTHMKAVTLQQWLGYDDAEIRRAAALACATKTEKTLVPDLIPLLEDNEPAVAAAAHAALVALVGQDLGPRADATSAERSRAVTAWKDWWAKNGGK